jgi:hypothetical protein
MSYDGPPVPFELWMSDGGLADNDAEENPFAAFEQTRALAQGFGGGEMGWTRAEGFLQEVAERRSVFETVMKRDAGEALKQFSAAGGAGGTGSGENGWTWARSTDPDPNRLEKRFDSGELRKVVSENGRWEFFYRGDELVSGREISEE